MRKTRMIFGIFALSLASTSCLRQKTQPRAFTPPPPRAWPTVPDTVPQLPDAAQIARDRTTRVSGDTEARTDVHSGRVAGNHSDSGGNFGAGESKPGDYR